MFYGWLLKAAYLYLGIFATTSSVDLPTQYVCPRSMYEAAVNSVAVANQPPNANVTSLQKSSSILTQVKVKESRNRPGVAQRVPGGLGSQIS